MQARVFHARLSEWPHVAAVVVAGVDDDNTVMSSAFRTRRRVEFRDTDAAGIAHFSVFFTYMEEAEHELWRHLGMSVKPARGAEVISWPRVAAQCDYKSAVKFEDEIDIEVRVNRVGERSVTFAFDLACGDRTVAAGKLTVVCCRIRKDAPPEAIDIPDEIRAKLASL